MARTAQIGRSQAGSAQVGSAQTGGGSASFSLLPASGHATGTIAITAYGTGTSWTGSNPFSVTGGTGSATISNYANASGTSSTFDLNLTALGTIIITDSDSGTTYTYDGSAVAPGAPTIGTAVKGNADASVPFTAPADNGGATITGYTATSSPGGFTGTGASSPITVSGLTNGTAYTFTVTATNSVGTGSASAASNSVTPSTVPSAATIGTAVAGNTSASVAFTPGSTGGATVTYTATSSPGGFTGAGSASPVTVSGLSNGTGYTFTVVASNINGSSSASSASNSVTPVDTVTATKLAPFLSTDTLGTPVAQAYENDSGTMTAVGTPPTVNTVTNITNGREAILSVPPNQADGGFAGVVRWSTGSGSPEYFCEELNIAPITTPVALVTRTVTKVCNLPLGTDISGTLGYQLMSGANAAIGSRVTAGIIATALVTGPDKFSADITLAPGSYFIVWDNGSGVYSHDELHIPGVAQPTGTKTATITLVDAGNTPRASLTGLKWAWWDQPTPNASTTPTDQGTGASTDGSGVFSITVKTALAASGVGWLVVTDSDGTTTQTPVHKSFAGPVAVA